MTSGVDGAEASSVGVLAESVGTAFGEAGAEMAEGENAGAAPGTPSTIGTPMAQPAAAAAIIAATPMDATRVCRPEAVNTAGI